MMIKDFRELRVWQEAHQLTLIIYKVTSKFTKEEAYGLTSQLRRAAVSVEANIAEGHGRFHYADEINFFVVSRGSCSEVQTLTLVALDLGYTDQKTSEEVVFRYSQLVRQINSYIKSKREQLKKG